MLPETSLSREQDGIFAAGGGIKNICVELFFNNTTFNRKLKTIFLTERKGVTLPKSATPWTFSFYGS